MFLEQGRDDACNVNEQPNIHADHVASNRFKVAIQQSKGMPRSKEEITKSHGLEGFHVVKDLTANHAAHGQKVRSKETKHHVVATRHGAGMAPYLCGTLGRQDHLQSHGQPQNRPNLEGHFGVFRRQELGHETASHKGEDESRRFKARLDDIARREILPVAKGPNE